MGREYRWGVCNRKCTEEILSDQRNTPSNSTDNPLCTSRCEPAGATREGCGRRGVESCPQLGEWTALLAWPAPPVPSPHSSRGDSTVLWGQWPPLGQCGCTLKSHPDRKAMARHPQRNRCACWAPRAQSGRQSKPVTRSRPCSHRKHRQPGHGAVTSRKQESKGASARKEDRDRDVEMQKMVSEKNN